MNADATLFSISAVMSIYTNRYCRHAISDASHALFAATTSQEVSPMTDTLSRLPLMGDCAALDAGRTRIALRFIDGECRQYEQLICLAPLAAGFAIHA